MAIDTQAFDRLCRTLVGPLYGYARNFTGNHHVAEDLTQECLARLFAQWRNGKLRDDTPAVRSLTFTILHNLAVDWRRTAKFTAELDESVPAPGRHDPECALLRQQLERAMADLPDNQRAALALREFGELSYAEIAATLDASMDEVKVWIHRARKRLAQLLDRDGQYIGNAKP